MKKRKSSLSKMLSKKTRKRIFEAMLKVIKKQMVNLVLNSSQEEVCEMIKGNFGNGLLSDNSTIDGDGREVDNPEMQEALYDISVNITAMQLKSKNKDELYKEFSKADKKIYKKLMEE